METEVETRATATWITIRGRLDTETAPALYAQLTALINEGHRNLVFQLAQLEYVSSAGLSSFIAAALRLEPEGGTVVLVSLQAFVKRVFDMAALTQVFRICESPDEI